MTALLWIAALSLALVATAHAARAQALRPGDLVSPTRDTALCPDAQTPVKAKELRATDPDGAAHVIDLGHCSAVFSRETERELGAAPATFHYLQPGPNGTVLIKEDAGSIHGTGYALADDFRSGS